uniref:Putative thiolase n=1 Tax=uncultured delta proteobacterium TaxID=34034 RepID=Q2YZR8_9DELT|nr:putative thiolase [uncultured delta proteobacterium]
MGKVIVLGAGMTRFGKYNDADLPWKNHEELGVEACLNALKHSGVNHQKIEAAYFGQTVTGMIQIGQRVTDMLGISGIPIYNHENACATSLAAFRNAYLDVKNGVHDIVLVAGVEKMIFFPKSKKKKEEKKDHSENSGGLLKMGSGGPIIMPEGMMFLQDIGVIMPAYFALIGRRHMEEYGTTREQFAKISVKNHKHGSMNPYAQYQNEVTLEQVLNSRMICDPITLLQCTPTGDGAAAVILASEKTAKKYTTKLVEVAGSVIMAGKYKASKGHFSSLASCRLAAQKLYDETGIGPNDLNVVEQHDCFTPHELVTYEDLGICKPGEGGRLVDEGVTALGGKVPFNVSGGLQAKGHPIAATGVAQVIELVWQLRGECGKRQVQGAKIGLAHNGGGIGPGLEPGLASVTMLKI